MADDGSFPRRSARQSVRLYVISAYLIFGDGGKATAVLPPDWIRTRYLTATSRRFFFHPVCRNRRRRFYLFVRRAREGSLRGEENRMTAANQERPAARRAAGRTYDQWFALLDRWGAPGRPYREIADWLEGEHHLSSWWAQKLIVEYEQARGLRPPGVRPDGTFTVGASKTVSVAVERLYAAVVDPAERDRWLPGTVMRERTSRPCRSARFDWGDGSRVSVTFEAKGETRSALALEHERLPDTEIATSTKAFWQERLTVLKAELEKATETENGS